MSDRQPGSRLLIDVFAYAAARLALVAVVTAVILGVGRLAGVQDFPVVVALLFAIVVALPLGMWVFAPLRRRATASIAAADARRRRDRRQLQARLRGEDGGEGRGDAAAGSADAAGSGDEATPPSP